MKTKHLLLTLLLALAVPLAALAQVERTATVYNGRDKECHVPVYGNLNVGDRSLSQFIMDKNVLQTVGLTGKQITKMTFYLANPVPASYQWTTPRYTYVTLAEVDASELDADGNVIQSEDMTDELIVAHLYLDAQGETMEIAFSTPYTYSGEKNLLVQFEEQYQFYPSGYTPFGPYRKPVFYGVYKDGASGWNKVTYTGGHPTRLVKYNFVPKTTFTYLDEATWANTNRPQNVTATPFYDIGNNNSINYKIQLQWDAPANYTGNYQVLCVPRGTSTLDWSNPIATSNTFYTFEGLQKNTSYDLYVRAKLGYVYTSAAATASATTPFYPANLDEGDLVFDFNSRTMPNGLTLAGNATYLVRPYTDHTYSLNRLGYYNVGAEVGSFDWMGRQHYLETTPLTITLPDLKFTNASNGLMVDFDLIREEVYYDAGPAQVLVKLHDDNYNEDLFSATASTDESYYNGQHFTYRITNVDQSSSQHIYKLSFSSVDGGKGFTIDNIVVRKAPAIIPAYNLAASEITPNSATISWMDDNTNSHTFDLVYRQKGYSNDPNEWQHYVEGVTNPYTLTGLTPYTDYEVKVKTITSSAYEDSEILEFSTLCTPAVVPYYEPFTGLTTLPTNWRVNVPEYAEVVTEVGNGRLTLHNTATEVTQNNYGYISTYTSYSEFGAYIILPYFNNLGSLQLSFKAGRTQGTMESLSVGVVADPNNYTDYTEIGTATLTDNANGEVYSYNLVNDAVQSGHIAIYFGKYESNLQSIWLDDFSVQQYAAPTNLEVSNVTNTSATLGWNAGAATEWEVRYKATTDSSWGIAIAVTEPACTITGLTANTEYTAQVRAKYGDGLYSTWEDGDFGTFKTLMQEAYALGATTDQTYFEDFESSVGNWMFVDGGSSGNRWRRFSYGDYGKGLRVTNSTASGSIINFEWKYVTCLESTFGGAGALNPATTYAVRTFNLSAGHYEFDYRYAVKGRANDDYMRVVLVPAETVLVNGTLPSGFDYANTPAGWFSLDGGGQLTGSSSYAWRTKSTVTLDVYPGGTYEPGNYMIIVLWNNEGTHRSDAAQNPPGAIDNVSVTWSSLVYPPTVAALHPQVTDTEAPLALYASEQGIAPTSYEVQYEPAAAVNTYEGAPIATFNVTENPQTVTLTGLTPLTIYSARVRSVYTANGHSVYSDWYDCHSLFTTLCPRPTHLVVVGQTSSWANVRWNPVEMTLPEGQYINYCVQLTTDLNDWGEEDCGWSSDSWEKNLSPGTYHFRVRTAVYQEEGNLYMGGSDWSEPITFTIAPWTDPVTIFPLTYDFEEWSNHFADGLTLDGDYDYLDILTYGVSDVPTPEEGDNEYALRFRSTANKTACLVLPPLRPSTSSALVSFWWYHNSSDNYAGEGVVVEYSSDGSSWTSFGDVIPRYAAETGWVKYQKVVPTLGTNASYIRLRFIGSNSGQWSRYCYLDDLTVHTLKSEQPYISYVAPGENTVTITLYDYAVENGYHSSQFEVQYREWRDPSETQETWVDYDVFVNQEPYTFETTLTVNGLQPATCYEFRARARVSFGGYDFDWSGYCEPVRQWTDCGTYTITPTYSYTEDFEELFNETDCWTGDIDETAWHVTTDDAHSGTSSFCVNGKTWKVLSTPTIDLSQLSNTTDNVVMRFWAKTSTTGCQVLVRYTYNGTTYNPRYMFIPKTDEWKQFEVSLSKRMGREITIEFKNGSSNTDFYLDDIEIVANPYSNTKIFDLGEDGYSANWTSSGVWFPEGTPDGSTNVRILEGNATVQTNTQADAQSVFVGPNGRLTVIGTLNVEESVGSNIAKINTATSGEISGSISIGSRGVLNASSLSVVDAYSFKVNDGGTANITTVNPGEANSVRVKNGGTLYAGSITGTSDEVDNTVVVEDGGQLRLDNPAYVTLKKNIGSYTEIEAENNVTKGGYYLISSPLNTKYFHPAMAGACTSDVNGADVVWTYDLYKFDYEQVGEEWRNYKPSPFLMKPGLGYLYANRDGVGLSFAGPVAANNTQMPVNTNYGEGSLYPFNGWTLVGNPYSCNTYISGSASDMSFYRMNPSGSGFMAATGAIKPMEGIFVYTQMAGQAVYFNRDEPTEPGSKLGINLMQGNVLVDNAIIRFAEGGELPKFSFSNNTSKVYIPMADDDYAVVSSQPVGVLPLNFEAAKDGTYTLSFEDATEGLLYCHLIDNLTGADVDLLSAGDCGSESAMTTEGVSYTFTAKKTDYAYRFKVVFVAKDEDGSSTGSETFAFNSNGNWIIANEGRATLQVIDLNGRILSSEQIEGSAETRIDAVPGLYLIRLINGENVKVQKVVVR